MIVRDTSSMQVSRANDASAKIFAASTFRETNAADSAEGRDGLVAALEALLRAEGAGAAAAGGAGKLRAALEVALGKK